MKPIARSQRILRIIDSAREPIGLGEIIRRLRTDPLNASQYNTIAAQLQQAVQRGDLQRHGKPHGYRYSIAPTRIEPEPQRPVGVAIGKRSVSSNAAPSIAPRKPYSHETASASKGPETVAEFIDRSGVIQHLANGEVSQPICKNVRELDAKRQRERDRKRAAESPEELDEEEAAA